MMLKTKTLSAHPKLQILIVNLVLCLYGVAIFGKVMRQEGEGGG